MVVEVVEVTPRPLPQVVAAVGSLESPEPTTLAAQVQGDVVALEVPEGESVEEGEVLARIDPRPLEAVVDVALARWRNARKRLARVRALHREGVSSQQALDDALEAYQTAEGQVEEARTRLADTAIRAPFRGVLGLRRVSLGDYVQPGDPVVDLTPDAALELRFTVPQRHAGLIARHQTLHGQVGPCGTRFEGRVTAVDPRVDPRSRTLEVEGLVVAAGTAGTAASTRSGVSAGPGSAGTEGSARAAGSAGAVGSTRTAGPAEAGPASGGDAASVRVGSDGRLAPGMGVRVRVLVGEWPEALLVPREALVRRGTQQLVYVLDEQDRAQIRQVELGAFFPNGVHVLEGLEAGDRVVASGHQKLRPGAPTRPQPWQPTHNPNLDLGRFGPVEACGEPIL